MTPARLRRLWDHRLLIGCSLLLWVMVIGAGVALYHFHFQPRGRYREAIRLPIGLVMPRVITGGAWLEKRNAFTDARLGWITAIVLLVPQRVTGEAMAVAGTEGAIILDESGAVRHHVTFEGCAARVDVVTLATGGPIWYFNDGSGSCKPSLLGPDGALVWQYEGGWAQPNVDAAVAGDLDGNGSVAVILAYDRWRGIQRIDASGRNVWEQPDSGVKHVELAHLDGTDRPVIVYVNSSGQLVIRDHQTGRLVQEPKRLVSYFSKYSLARWPSKSGSAHVLGIDTEKLLLIELDGTVAWQRDAPLAGTSLWPIGTPVRLKAGQPASFAVVALWFPWGRSVLWIYDQSGGLVYHEVIAEACGAIQALPDVDAATDTLLLGCGGTVWQYLPVK